MNEQTLFEEYPPEDKKAKPARRDDCCDKWAIFIDECDEPPHKVWDFCHRWGHRRTSFSVDALAEVAGTTDLHAQAVIAWAVRQGWITPIQPEYYQTVADRLWTGRLPKER